MRNLEEKEKTSLKSSKYQVYKIGIYIVMHSQIKVLKWHDKRDVLMFSTWHGDNMVATGKINREGNNYKTWTNTGL